MSSDMILAIIFIFILGLAAAVKLGLKKPVVTNVILGAGALALMAATYLLHNTTVPAWILGLSGILLFVDAWLDYKKK